MHDIFSVVELLMSQSRWVHVSATYDPVAGQASMYWDGNIQNFGTFPSAVVATRAIHYVGSSLSFDLGLSALGKLVIVVPLP